MSATLTTWPKPYIARCANEDCLAIFLAPPKYEPLASFCPACRAWLRDQAEAPNAIFEEADDGRTQ